MEIVEENEHIEPPTHCLLILFLATLSFCWVRYSTEVRRADPSRPWPLRCCSCLARTSFHSDDHGGLEGRAEIRDGRSALRSRVVGGCQPGNMNNQVVLRLLGMCLIHVFQ